MYRFKCPERPWRLTDFDYRQGCLQTSLLLHKYCFLNFLHNFVNRKFNIRNNISNILSKNILIRFLIFVCWKWGNLWFFFFDNLKVRICEFSIYDGVANFLRNALSNCSHLPPEWVNMLGSWCLTVVEYGEQPVGIWIFPLYPLRSRVRGDPIYFSRYYGPPPTTNPLAFNFISILYLYIYANWIDI